MAKKINLKSYTFRPPQPSYVAGDILRKARQNAELSSARQHHGAVTHGFSDITILEGGGKTWGITEYIPFSYKYFSKPTFSWGVEGTYSGTTENENPYGGTGDNTYSKELPKPLQDLIDNEDFDAYQPAIIVPRVIHWHMENSFYFVGCYLLVYQINEDCNEVEKLLRLHFRFEGPGIPIG